MIVIAVMLAVILPMSSNSCFPILLLCKHKVVIMVEGDMVMVAMVSGVMLVEKAVALVGNRVVILFYYNTYMLWCHMSLTPL